MMIMIIKIISTFLLGNIVIAAKAPAPSAKLLETVNCHFDTADVGCSMGFEQTWTESRNQGSHRMNILRRNTTTLAHFFLKVSFPLCFHGRICFHSSFLEW